MSYGLKIFNSLGHKILDTNHHTLKFRWASTVSSATSSYVVLNDIIGRIPIGCSMAIGGGAPHRVDVSGSTVSWAPQVNGAETSGKSLIYVFLMG